MEMNLTQLCHLDPINDDNKILAKCISIWKSHPLGKPNEVWSLDAVLQDQQDQLRRTIILEDVHGAQLEYFFLLLGVTSSLSCTTRESTGHVVMILQLCKVKYFNEKPYVSPAMYSTKLYLNDDIQEIAPFRQRYSEKGGFDRANHTIALLTPVKKEVTADDFFKGAIKKTVGSIRDSDGPYHCLLYAKIHKIHRENGWTYLACKKYGRSAKEADSDESLSSGSASLLLFDDLVFKLTYGEQCHTLIQKHGLNYDDYFPPELQLNRRQYPMSLCFVMTINKSQGQTLSK
nr:replication protein A 70 kDa DNA-binding subunit B [Tanacetum cinerariifolium]